jgi:hypothetical protein
MFSSYYANKLTEYSSHFLDWSRVGELLAATQHRYTPQQILARGSMFTVVAISAALGKYFNQADQTGYSDLAVAAASAFVSFATIHTIALVPIVQKRCRMSRECQTLAIEINDLLDGNNFSDDYKNKIKGEIFKISELSLSDEQHSRASQTWGQRKRLMSELRDKVTSDIPGKKLTLR